jgi:hypothetical protein
MFFEFLPTWKDFRILGVGSVFASSSQDSVLRMGSHSILQFLDDKKAYTWVSLLVWGILDVLQLASVLYISETVT